MKKILVILFALLLTLSIKAALSTTVVVPANTMTNLVNLSGSGHVIVTAYVVTSTNATAVTASLMDTPTNVLAYVVPAYTNITSYATNWVQTWTNYYGATNSWTNYSLIDITNSVAQSTNNYPVRIALTAAANTSAVLNPTYTVFDSGVWVTNSSAAAATVTIQYRQ